MNRKTHTSRRIVSALALIGSVAAIAVPTASAGNQNDPGIVLRDAGDATATKLVVTSRHAPPMTVVRDAGDATEAKNALPGDYMFRDYFRGTHFTNDGSSLVARQLGSPDIRDAAQTRSESAMLTDLSGMHWASPLTVAPVVASRQVTSAQIERSEAMNNLLHHTIQPAPVDTQVTSDNGVNWGKVGIGIAVAVCGLLLLGALGIGARQIRHGGQRLGRA